VQENGVQNIHRTRPILACLTHQCPLFLNSVILFLFAAWRHYIEKITKFHIFNGKCGKNA
jgi:hypothetical protein